MLGKPKYTYGDVVKFECDGEKTGAVAIIDRYGTFEQNEEPSYDLLNKDENILYKHCRESWIIEKVGEMPREEIWKWKELGHDLHSISIPAKLLGCASKGLDIESTSKRVYKQVCNREG